MLFICPAVQAADQPPCFMPTFGLFFVILGGSLRSQIQDSTLCPDSTEVSNSEGFHFIKKIPDPLHP